MLLSLSARDRANAANDTSGDKADLAASPGGDTDASVRRFGARGDGIADDTDAFAAALDRLGEAFVPRGRYRVSAIGPAEFQKPIYFHGVGAGSVIELGQPMRAPRPTLRVAATGGAFGDVRAPTLIEKLVFKRAGAATVGALTAIDLQSVHTYKIGDVTMIGLGAAALKMTSCYYGAINGLSLANSGILLSDVNNCSIHASDIRPDEFTDKTRGAAFFRNGDYPITLVDSAKTTFVSSVIEGWSCPVLLLRRSSNTVLNSCWLEELRSPTHVIRCENTASLDIVDSWIDLSLPYGGCFIEVDNSAAKAPSDTMRLTQVRLKGGTLTGIGRAFGDAGKLVRAVNGEKVRVLIEGVTFRGGRLHADPSVDFDVRSMTFSGPFRHFVSSLPNAYIQREHNSWMPRSRHRNWNFDMVNLFPQTDTVSVYRATGEGEFLTGTCALKAHGFPPRGIATVKHNTSGMLGAVRREGQSYIVFARVKSDVSLDIKVEVNGGYKDFADNPFIGIRAGEWRDIIFKTQEDVTWAQGRYEAPSILFYVRNTGSSIATLYLDRLDYACVEGDHAF
jgi:hypothetical protein